MKVCQTEGGRPARPVSCWQTWRCQRCRSGRRPSGCWQTWRCAAARAARSLVDKDCWSRADPCLPADFRSANSSRQARAHQKLHKVRQLPPRLD